MEKDNMGVLYWSYNNHGNRILLYGNHYKCINWKCKKLSIRSYTRNENRSIYADYQNNGYTDGYNTFRTTVSELEFIRFMEVNRKKRWKEISLSIFWMRCIIVSIWRRYGQIKNRTFFSNHCLSKFATFWTNMAMTCMIFQRMISIL